MYAGYTCVYIYSVGSSLQLALADNVTKEDKHLY